MSLGKIVKEYDYRNAKGEVVHQTLRFEPKTFRQRRKPIAGDDKSKIKEGWVWSLSEWEGVVLYRLPELIAAPRHEMLFLVEGEKDADTLAALGLNVTSVPMGAGKWRDSYGRYFRNRWVVIIEDFDKANEHGERPGEKGAEDIALEVMDAGADKVGILKMRDLWPAAPEGSDISDWVAAMGNSKDPETMVHELQYTAARAEIDIGLAMAATLILSDRGAAQILEDLFARRFMLASNLIYCAARFWAWDVRSGVWVAIEDDAIVEKKIRLALSAGGHDHFITSRLVAALLKMCKSERFLKPDDLNRPLDGQLCVANGILDVDALRVQPHQPGLRITTKCPHAFDELAACPGWMAWLEDRLEDEETRGLVQEMFGYCLVTDLNFHKFFFIYGDGGTGKSTCVNVLEWLIGESNRVSVELTELDNAFMRSSLVGKSLYLCKELTSRSFKHIGLIKSIVGGDPIPVDVKYSRGFDFCPTGRFVMESNVIAATPDSSGGFERRFIQVDFDKKINRETMVFGFEKQFKAEMSGILNWALEGYARLKARGRFIHTAKSEQATKDLLKHRAQVQSFIDSGALVTHSAGVDGYAKQADIFHAFNDWCEAEDVVPFFREEATFMREFMTRKPGLKKLKKRIMIEGDRYWVIAGVAISSDYSN